MRMAVVKKQKVTRWKKQLRYRQCLGRVLWQLRKLHFRELQQAFVQRKRRYMEADEMKADYRQLKSSMPAVRYSKVYLMA